MSTIVNVCKPGGNQKGFTIKKVGESQIIIRCEEGLS